MIRRDVLLNLKRMARYLTNEEMWIHILVDGELRLSREVISLRLIC